VTAPRSLLLLVLVAALVGVGMGVDAALPPPSPDAGDEDAAGPATSGAWYCAAAGTGADDVVDVVAAAPPGDASTPAELAVEVAREGETAVASRPQLVPGASASVRPAGAAGPVALTTRWWDQPVAVTRLWEITSGDGVSGRIVGPCERRLSDRWVVPGVATAGGAQAHVHLANPFDSDAAVTITLTTPDGVLAPRLLENVVVPKRSSRVVDLNEHAPERADLGVVVRTRSGRVVAEAVQSFNAAIGGVEGLSLVRALPELAETWTIPWFADGGDAASWLWLTNPDTDRAAAVELTVHTADGGGVPEGLEEITLDPGTVQRIDLRGLLPDGVTSGALTVRSDNGIPIAAAVGSQRGGEVASPDTPDDGAPDDGTDDDEPDDGTDDQAPEDDGEATGEEEPAATEPTPEERSGIAVLSGAAEAGTSWVLTGGPTAGRTVTIQVVNVSAEEAVVDLTLWAGSGLVRPDGLQGVTVAPGAVRSLDVSADLAEAADHTVFVRARQGLVVVGRVGTSAEGRLGLTAHTGLVMDVYEAGRLRVPVDFAPGMSQRIGTRLDHAADDGEGDEPSTPTPTAPGDEAEEPVDPEPTDGGATTTSPDEDG
jgi:hypothetical protein